MDNYTYTNKSSPLFPQSRNLSPSLADFPPKFGTFGFHSRKPLVYEPKLFTGEMTQPFPRIAHPSRIKADQQKENVNVHLPKRKKNNIID